MTTTIKGRFAPSPSGRMHLGNLFTALLSWLSAKSQGGDWLLRIEDLDPQRSKIEWAKWIEDDLDWLGLVWDEGGLQGRGMAGSYLQSERGEFYESALKSLEEAGLIYPCYCTRADILATQAPHQTDGRVVYAGTCRPGSRSVGSTSDNRPAARRLMVPDAEMVFTDGLLGVNRVNLASHCGDFVVRRADGAWAYQLAVVVDDSLMGVTEVVRGNDLLLSTAQQQYLRSLLGYADPLHYHLPLVSNQQGVRLSKRDPTMSMEALRMRFTANEIIGRLGCMAGLLSSPESCSAASLVECFDWSTVTSAPTVAAVNI